MPHCLDVFYDECQETARIFYLLLAFQNKIGELTHTKFTDELYKNINKLPYFLNYYEKTNFYIFIISIGRIFDTDSRSHTIDYCFTQLREKKYLTHLSKNEIKLIKEKKEEMEGKWKKLKPIRNKIIAHNNSKWELKKHVPEKTRYRNERQKLLSSTDFLEIESLILDLLSFRNGLYNITMNKHTPCFETRNRSIQKECEKEMDEFFKILSRA